MTLTTTMEMALMLSRQFILIALLSMMACTAVAEVKIAVAANFAQTNRQLMALFEKMTGYHVIASYESTGKLYAQIKNGAPYEVFLAADSVRPQRAEQEGLAIPGKRYVYARGKLVLWTTRKGLFKNGKSYLENGNFAHLAIANPKTAPYGLAARQVLEHLGLWSRLQNRLVRGESIAQTFQFVVSQNAQAGIIASSQMQDWHGATGSSWIIPESYYKPIEQSVVLLKKGANNPAALAYFNFLRSVPARKIIIHSGYDVKPDGF